MTVDPQEYDRLYHQLLTERGRADIGDDPLHVQGVADKINRFLELYPKTIPPTLRTNPPIADLSLREVYRRTIQTAVDIMDDTDRLLAKRGELGSDHFRRELFGIFTNPDRRLYVGIWLIVGSFLLYFIDSAA